jgi:hypothetical protein
MFGHLLGLGSFDSLEGSIVCKQISFPITFGGVELISTSTITPTTYLRSWAQCPFLFEALAQVDNNTFPFPQHFKMACDLLLPPTCVCLPPFE